MSTQPTTTPTPASRYNGWAVVINSAAEAMELSDLYKRGRGTGNRRIRLLYAESVYRFDCDSVAFCACYPFGAFDNKAWYTGLVSSFEQGGAEVLTLAELKRALVDVSFPNSNYAELNFGVPKVE